MTVQVGKLTIRTAQRGAGRNAAARMRIESLIRSLDLHPVGLPERSILIVRRIQLGPGDRGTAQRARTALAQFRRVAGRPAAGLVAPSAKAVLFADEVELLTCLTADLVRGVAHSRWYWRQIGLGVAAERGAALAAVWGRHVRWLPGCLARLAESDARSAVALLSPSDAARVLCALLAAFGVKERPFPLPQPGPQDPPHPSDWRRPTGAGARSAECPWRGVLKATSLHPDAEALLGVALSLQYAPSLVHRPGYAERVADWLVAARNIRWQRVRTRGSPPSTVPAGSASREPATPTGAPLARTDSGHGRLVPGSSAGTIAQARTVPGADAAQSHDQRAGLTRSLGIPAADSPWASEVPPTGKPPAKPHGDDDTPRTWASGWPQDGIATGLAPLLFLVNFIAWLDDEEEAAIPAGWALVELLGRYLLGPGAADFAGDPLWDLLAELDGRRVGTPPDIELRAADPLRLPPAWLRRWPPPSSSYIARRDGKRLAVRHREAGFVVADVPCPRDRIDEVRMAEAELLGGAEIVMEPQARSVARTPAQRFGDAVGAFVSWMLRSRGIDVSSLTSPGRIVVSGTHVDVVLSLEDIDLAVRAAGLDRDPGWVPALGRIVLFHFLEAW